MSYMLLHCATIDHNVIYVYIGAFPYLLLENPVHGALKHTWCICKAKRKSFKMEEACGRDECCLGLILFLHGDLPITTPEVKSGEDRGTPKLVKYVLDQGERV